MDEVEAEAREELRRRAQPDYAVKGGLALADDGRATAKLQRDGWWLLTRYV